VSDRDQVSRQKVSHVEDPKALGRRLRELRTEAGLSRRELGFPGCSPAYIAKIEAGDRVPSLQVLRELARRLQVSEGFLVNGSDPESSFFSGLLEAEVALRLDDFEQALVLYEEALEQADTDALRSQALEGLGHVACRAGDPRQAVEYLTEALRLGGDEPFDRPRLTETLGRVYASLGELAPAIALFERCVEHFDHELDPIQYVRFACLLGYALTDNGDFAAAERVVARALVHGRAVTDPYTRSRLYWSQARLLLEQGKSDLAERYARKTLDTLSATEDTYALGHAHQLLANVYLDLGRPEEAEELLREGRPLIASAANKIELAHYQIEEARVLAALGREEEAAALAMKITPELGEAQPGDAGRAYLLLAEIFEDVGERVRAKELYELGVELLEQQGPNRYVVGGYRSLARLLKDEGRSEEALRVLERAVDVQEQVGRALR
jgi:tetratricopeptide (TPR) repeat protein